MPHGRIVRKKFQCRLQTLQMGILLLRKAEPAMQPEMLRWTAIWIVPLEVNDFMRKDDGKFGRLGTKLIADVDDTLGNRGAASAPAGSGQELDRVPARPQVSHLTRLDLTEDRQSTFHFTAVLPSG